MSPGVDQGTVENLDAIERAGLTRLGESGTPEDVQSAWKMFVSVNAEPFVRISDALGEVSLSTLEQTWKALAAELGIISGSGEFLLTVGGKGTLGLPWFHVRAAGRLAIRDLGMYPGVPEFIASSLDRSVSIAVSTEESEFWILVAHADA
ncbi:hypothetical protein [Promicromonospora soli]